MLIDNSQNVERCKGLRSWGDEYGAEYTGQCVCNFGKVIPK